MRSSRKTSLVLCDILPKIRTAPVPSLCNPSSLSPAVKLHRAKRSPYDKLDLRLNTAQTQLEHKLLRNTITPTSVVCEVKMRFLTRRLRTPKNHQLASQGEYTLASYRLRALIRRLNAFLHCVNTEESRSQPRKSGRKAMTLPGLNLSL